jgi:uncharacterized protein (DUF983 family)
MERNVRVQDRTNSVRRRRFLLRQCPHCGGDVRLVRDIYGSYRQCIQCSREIQPDALQMPVTHPLVAPLHAGEEELLAA